jgi:hypothetical protein
MLQGLAVWQQEVSKGLATTLQQTCGFYGARSSIFIYSKIKIFVSAAQA